MSAQMRCKSVSLTFRGFEMKAEEVIALVSGSASSEGGNRGEQVRPTVKTLLVHSYARFSMDFKANYPLNRMLSALLEKLGGVDHLLWVRDQVKPNDLDFDFLVPARSSEHIQDGYFSEQEIVSVVKLGASLGIGFF